MNLGGPVWHASVATRRHPDPAVLEAQALRQLQGVGDAILGEWREWTGHAFHIRRRLSAREQNEVGPVVDIRRTDEALRRAAALGERLSLVPPQVLAEELGVGRD
jgi:hypothetical protein